MIMMMMILQLAPHCFLVAVVNAADSGEFAFDNRYIIVAIVRPSCRLVIINNAGCSIQRTSTLVHSLNRSDLFICRLIPAPPTLLNPRRFSADALKGPPNCSLCAAHSGAERQNEGERGESRERGCQMTND